jgi:hypothetical protein
LRGSTRKSQELLDTPETLEQKATLDAAVSDRAGLTDAGVSRVMRRAARASRRDTPCDAQCDRVETGLGTYSGHHVQPAFFGGFESLPDSGIKLAVPEKALVDFLYLSPTRGRLFTALPELELPRSFRRSVAREWVGRIPSQRLRTIVAPGWTRCSREAPQCAANFDQILSKLEGTRES